MEMRLNNNHVSVRSDLDLLNQHVDEVNMTYRPNRQVALMDVIIWGLVMSVGWTTGMFPIMLYARGTVHVGIAAACLPPIIGGIMGLCGGLIISTLWLILCKNLTITSTDEWVFSTVMGTTLGGLVVSITALPVMIIFGAISDNTGAWVLSGAVLSGTFGCILGLFQWGALRYHIAHARWWIGASVVGWFIAGGVFWLVYRGLGGPLFLPWFYHEEPWPGISVFFAAMVSAYLIGGIILSMVMGTTLRLLLSRHT